MQNIPTNEVDGLLKNWVPFIAWRLVQRMPKKPEIVTAIVIGMMRPRVW